jgi:hypothetical protein
MACRGGNIGCCEGGYIGTALNYIINTGVVDGSDLATYAEGGTGISLIDLAAEFGRTDCP